MGEREREKERERERVERVCEREIGKKSEKFRVRGVKVSVFFKSPWRPDFPNFCGTLGSQGREVDPISIFREDSSSNQKQICFQMNRGSDLF